jgi:hypothetical protein
MIILTPINLFVGFIYSPLNIYVVATDGNFPYGMRICPWGEGGIYVHLGGGPKIISARDGSMFGSVGDLVSITCMGQSNLTSPIELKI